MLEKNISKSYTLVVDFLDYGNRKDATKNIVYSEGDINTAFINATLILGGEVIDLTGCEVIIGIKNNSGEKLINSCIIENAVEGKVTIPFTTTALSMLGVNNFEVVLYKGDKKIVSPKYSYRVVESVSDEDFITGSNNYDILLVLMGKVQDVLDKSEGITSRIEEFEKEVVASENLRIENEKLRQTQEEKRKENELLRISNETTRQAQEENRQTIFGQKITEIDNKLVEVDDIVSEKLTAFDKDVSDTINEKFEEKSLEFESSMNTSISNKFDEVDAVLEGKLAETDKKVDEKTVEIDKKISQADLKITEMTTAITTGGEKINAKIEEINIVKTQLINSVDAKIFEVDTAKTDMSNTISTKMSEFEDRFTSLESANPTGEVIQSRISVDGKTHDSLAKRLEYDYGLKADKANTYTKDEVDGMVGNSSSINDGEVSPNATWSSQKINVELNKKETIEGCQAKVDKALNDSKKYTDTKVADLIGQSPDVLDTLEELATALGNDPNFATTVSSQIGQKADKTSVYTKEEVNEIVSNSTSIDDEVVNLENTWSSHKINEGLNSKVSKVEGKGLSTNDFTNEEKGKLSSLINYVHPNDEETRHVTDVQISNWNSKAEGNHIHNNYSLTTHQHSYSELNDKPVLLTLDDENIVEDKTWSSSKINTELEQVRARRLTNIAFDTVIGTSDWIESQGEYSIDVVHGLTTDRIVVTAIDSVTKEGLLVAYKIIDDDTVRITSINNNEIFLTVLNGNSEFKISENSDRKNIAWDVNVGVDDWAMEDGLATVVVNHKLFTEKVLVNAISTDTKESLKIAYKVIDVTKIKVSILNPTNALITVLNGEKEFLNLVKEGTEIEDSIVSQSSTWSSQKIQEELALSSRVIHWNDIVGKPEEFNPSEHNHNEIYYQKRETDAFVEPIDNSFIDGLFTGSTVKINGVKYYTADEIDAKFDMLISMIEKISK